MSSGSSWQTEAGKLAGMILAPWRIRQKMEEHLEQPQRACRKVRIQNPEGMHLRAVTMLIQLARGFASSIWVSNHNLRADAKTTPLQLLALGAQPGDELTIEAIGPDAQQAVDAIVRLIENRFEEPLPGG